jgi:hypothetical protein
MRIQNPTASTAVIINRCAVYKMAQDGFLLMIIPEDAAVDSTVWVAEISSN